MKKISLSIVFLSSMVLMNCYSSKKEKETEAEDNEAMAESAAISKSIEVPLSPKSGSKLTGTVSFTQENDGPVTMTVHVENVDAGEHAIHIHEKPDCSAEDGSSAGGHWNPATTQHGKWEANVSHHAGDIGNLQVGSDGTGNLTFTTDQWCIACDDPMKSLLSHSVVIHAGVDDFVTQPTGNAGGRIGCAVIE